MVLLVTLVILTILATLGYTLTSALSAYRHRQEYMVHYQIAQYGCDSGIKYAMAIVEEMDLDLVSRPNEPDFSDIFALDDEQYQFMVEDWIRSDPSALWQSSSNNNYEDENSSDDDLSQMLGGLLDSPAPDGPNHPNEPADLDEIDLSEITIPGPYGAAWPKVRDKITLEVGDAEVTISIEDENAKYPIGWAMLDDDELSREAVAGFRLLCEWMRMDREDIDQLSAQLNEARDLKAFKKDFSEMQRVVTVVEPRRTAIVRGREQTLRRERTRRQNVADTVHMADFSRIFHSAILDSEILAKPLFESELRNESAQKYISRWGVNKVNVNTAPRHVLEALFTFGGDASELADAVIRNRKIEPFEDFDHLRSTLLHFSGSLDRCEDFLTTESNFFTIRVESISGPAKASAALAVRRNDEGELERVAIIYD